MSWPNWTGTMTGDAYNVMRNPFNPLVNVDGNLHLHIVWKFGGGCAMAASAGLCRSKLQRIGQSDKAHSDRHVHHANVAQQLFQSKGMPQHESSARNSKPRKTNSANVGAFGNRDIQKNNIPENRWATFQTFKHIAKYNKKGCPWICFHLSRFNPCCPTCCPPTVHPAPMHKGKAVGSRKPRNARSQLTCRSAASSGLSHCHSQPHKRNQTPNAMSPTLHCHLFGESAQTGLLRHHDAVVLLSHDTKNPL